MQYKHDLIVSDEIFYPMYIPIQEDGLYDRKTIAVIGAGIAGITMAYSLARRGYEVEVLEQESYPAMQTSYANGGQWSVSNSDTWNTWLNVGHGLKWMLRRDAPLLVRPLPTLSKMRWLAGFLWNTANGTHAANTRRTIELALWARGLYQDIADHEDLEFDHKQSGILHIYKDERSWKRALDACDFYQGQGVNRLPLTAKRVLELEPALQGAKGIVGGTITHDDAMGDIHKFCGELARVLEERYSVKFFYDTQVLSLWDWGKNVGVSTCEAGRGRTRNYAHVVMATGADSARWKWMVNDLINVYPVKGYSITIPDVDPSLLPGTSLLDDDAKIVTSSLGDRLRVAGTAELDGWNRDIRISRIQPLVRWVQENLPDISTEHAIPWAGLRPMTPNMMPIARRSRGNPRIWWHTGHGHLGWTLSAATAEIVAGQLSEATRR